MKAFYSDTFVLPLPEGHRFPMAKYSRLRERLVAERILAPPDLLVPPAASWDELALAHDASYLDAVASGALPADAQRRIGFPWSPEMVERSRRSVGATIAAARAALADRAVAVNLAGGTHHAFRDRGEGYCVFNDVAVAARVLMRERHAASAAVIDCDVHQGNGTASLFRGDETVFTFSIHQEYNYPTPKEPGDLDVGLEDGTGDDEYLAELGKALERVWGAEPGLVVYLAGADAYREDQLGGLGLTMAGLEARDQMVLQGCARRGVPVVVTLGGGYARRLEDTVAIHFATCRLAIELGRGGRGGGGAP